MSSIAILCFSVVLTLYFYLRYCAELPGDAFTSTAPRWSIHKTLEGVICKLELPIQSGIRSPVQVSIERTVFFETD